MRLHVSVIIVHWNTPDSLKKLLSALGFEKNTQVTVIDNASEQSVKWISKEFPHVQLVQNKKNIGYATACNQGTHNSKGEWLVFLNPDVSITNKELFNLIGQAKKKQLDAFSIEAREDYKKPLPSGMSLLAEFTPLKYIIPLRIFHRNTLTGGLLFIKNDVLKKTGGWDQRFFLWFEDSDLTKRLYDGGYRIGWIKSNIRHVGGESFQQFHKNKKRRIFFSSMNKYAEKHLGIFGNVVAKLLKKRYVS